MEEENNYEKEFTEDGFWTKVKAIAKQVGSELIEKALILYAVWKDPDTSISHKAIVLGALGYLISPIDAIPDLTPIIGYADDLGVIVLALASIAKSIKEEHKAWAKEMLAKLFG